MERKPHYFYALKLSEEIKLYLKELCAKLEKEFPFQRWVHHEDYHITLAFLGAAKDQQLQASLEYIETALQKENIFTLLLNQLGVFGRQDSPRIFWAGVEEKKQLHHVRGLIFDACKKAGFALETRPFRPHITLARKWSGDWPFSERLLEKNNSFLTKKQPFNAYEVVLYETHLDRMPKYEVKHSFLLKTE